MQDNLSDEALMAAYLGGDSSAFELIYKRYSRKVLAFLRKKLKDTEDQNEVFQLVFLKFHKSRESYDSKYPLLQWLYVITRSTFLDYLRHRERLNQVTATYRAEVETNQSMQDEDNEPLVKGNILSDLNLIQAEVVKQRVFDESSYEEIAKKLHLTESNVRQTFSRAIKKLRLAQTRSK